MYKPILDKIKEYDYITIYRHQRPDGDCMFSALALYEFLKDNFKEKQVKIAGEDTYEIITKKHKISDSFVKKSLAIVVDTSSINRIDDSRATEAPFMIKIDHHPVVDNYGNLNYVDEKAAACAELLAVILMSEPFKLYKVSKKVCEYLYCGMITDTINFRTANTTYKTLEIAALLAKKGDLRVSDLVEMLTDKDIVTFQKISKIRNHLKIDQKCGYIVLDKKDLARLDMDGWDAKNQIDEIGKIKDLKIWLFAVDVNGKYDVSVRSKRGYIINGYCAKLGGGGHANAAGIKQITKNDLKWLISELVELSTKKPKMS